MADRNSSASILPDSIRHSRTVAGKRGQHPIFRISAIACSYLPACTCPLVLARLHLVIPCQLLAIGLANLCRLVLRPDRPQPLRQVLAQLFHRTVWPFIGIAPHPFTAVRLFLPHVLH